MTLVRIRKPYKALPDTRSIVSVSRIFKPLRFTVSE